MDELLPALLETRLRQRLRDNDRAAFDAVAREHHGRVFRQLFALTGGDNARAADLSQETFLAAWQSLPTFSGRSGIGIWLHTIAVRVWFRAGQKAKRGATEMTLADALAELLASTDADPATGAANASALATLTPPWTPCLPPRRDRVLPRGETLHRNRGRRRNSARHGEIRLRTGRPRRARSPPPQVASV